MTKAAAALLLAAAAATASAGGGAGVRGTKHDLSVFGPGPIRATTETNPCTFCHIPHNRSGSSRPDTVGHIPYESSTMKVRPGLPTGASRVCLSCHDGTIAVGQTKFRKIPMVIDAIPAERASNLGTDLRKTHPVSFVPAPGDFRTHAPPPGDAVKLDKGGQVQCTSCHDPHDEFKGDPSVGKFLVKSERNAELCLTCHEAGRIAPPGASHAGAAARFDVPQGNTLKFLSVAEAGCRACHRPHGAAPEGRILDRAPNDDDGLCLRCHSGPVARVNVRSDWTKPYSHGAAGQAGVHDAAEGRPGARRALPESSPGASRHVVCADCHEPHAARREPSTGAPLAGGALAGASGVDLAGQRVEPVRFEYEVCLKCHGDSANKPQPLGGRRGDSIRRASGDYNLRTQIAPTAISAHPIAGPGRSADVPGLKAPYTAQSVIFCGDCHGSDSGPARGGSGSRGPHGSIYPFLLDSNYDTRDGTVETAQSYALCYRCHDRDVLLSTQSRFTRQAGPQGTSLHRLHVVQQNTPCSACHAAHGISAQWGTAQENAHLVDFDVLVVKQRAGAPRRYRSTGAGHGSCNLSCHGKDHDEGTATY